MNEEQRRYVVRETLVSVVINSILSALFALAAFGFRGTADVDAIVVDALPQSFAIALMTTFVPTLITRKRLKAGKIAPLAHSGVPLPDNIVARALAVAITAAVIGGALHWLLLPQVSPRVWPASAVLPYKIVYGALLATILSPFILRRALADGSSSRQQGR